MPQQWSEDYLIGIEKIDRQHEAFFTAAQRLYDEVLLCRGDKAIAEALSFLRDYAEKHFQEEEGLMRDHEFPGLQEHRALHAGFMEQLGNLEEEFNQDRTGTEDLANRVLELTQDWLVDHIQTQDMRYAKHINPID
jgi:hemerythrin